MPGCLRQNDVDHRTMDHPNVFLCVSSFNPDARRPYQRLGYEYIGELKDFIVTGHSELIYRKTRGAADARVTRSSSIKRAKRSFQSTHPSQQPGYPQTAFANAANRASALTPSIIGI